MDGVQSTDTLNMLYMLESLEASTQQSEPVIASPSADEVGIFWPNCPYTTLTTNYREKIFLDVVRFCEHIVSLIPLRSEAILRTMVGTQLQGEALLWWTTEVSEIDKLAISTDVSGNLIQFTTRIKARFHNDKAIAERVARSQQFVFSSSYSRADVRNGKNMSQWFDFMLHHAERAGLETGHPRLVAIWNALSPSMKTKVGPPLQTTSVQEYRAHLESKYLLWEAAEAGHRILRPLGSMQSQKVPSQGNNHQQGQEGLKRRRARKRYRKNRSQDKAQQQV